MTQRLGVDIVGYGFFSLSAITLTTNREYHYPMYRERPSPEIWRLHGSHPSVRIAGDTGRATSIGITDYLTWHISRFYWSQEGKAVQSYDCSTRQKFCDPNVRVWSRACASDLVRGSRVLLIDDGTS
jgi:hypothetical protein